MIGRVSLAALWLATSASIAVAQSDPTTIPREIYAAYIKAKEAGGKEPDMLTLNWYSKRVQAKIIALQKACKGKEICMPDADFLIDGQDFQITKLDVKLLQSKGTKTDVEARFNNFDTAQHVIFTLVNEGGRWVIDDLWMRSAEDKKGYRLDPMLTPIKTKR